MPTHRDVGVEMKASSRSGKYLTNGNLVQGRLQRPGVQSEEKMVHRLARPDAVAADGDVVEDARRVGVVPAVALAELEEVGWVIRQRLEQPRAQVGPGQDDPVVVVRGRAVVVQALVRPEPGA